MNEKEVESLVEKQGYSNSDIYAELYYQYPIFLNVNEKYRLRPYNCVKVKHQKSH